MTDIEKENELPLCFVIQPFDDGGTYDLRYKETIKPALEKAGLRPRRADEILGLTPVIEKIEVAISNSPICVAEVTEDNPNVWLELGYALALGRPTVILCEKQVRPKLPFDVQHRSVVFYRTDSKSGFEELEKQIIRLVKHELDNAEKIERSPVVKPGDVGNIDLQEFEVAILTTVFSYSTGHVGGAQTWDLENKLKNMGYSDFALALAITNLTEKGLLSSSVELIEDDMNSYDAKVYRATDAGVKWIQNNQHSLEIRPPAKSTPSTKFDDDIPF